MRKRVEYMVLSVPVLIAVIVTQACLETGMPPEFEPGPLGAVRLEADESHTDPHAALGHGRSYAR